MVEAPSTLPEVWKLLIIGGSDCWCYFPEIFVAESLLLVLLTNGGTPRAARKLTVEPFPDPGRSQEILENSVGHFWNALQGKKHQFGLMSKPSSPRQQAAASQEGGHLNFKRRNFLQQHSAALLTTRENNIQPNRNPQQTLEPLPVSAAGTGSCCTLAQENHTLTSCGSWRVCVSVCVGLLPVLQVTSRGAHDVTVMSQRVLSSMCEQPDVGRERGERASVPLSLYFSVTRSLSFSLSLTGLAAFPRRAALWLVAAHLLLHTNTGGRSASQRLASCLHQSAADVEEGRKKKLVAPPAFYSAIQFWKH